MTLAAGLVFCQQSLRCLPQILRCAHCQPHKLWGMHFIVTANTEELSTKQGFWWWQKWLAFRKVRYASDNFRHLSTSTSPLFHPQWSYLISQLSTLTKKICPLSFWQDQPSAVSLCAPHQGQTAASVASVKGLSISHTNFKLTKGPCHRLVWWTRSTWWTWDRQEHMILCTQLIYIYTHWHGFWWPTSQITSWFIHRPGSLHAMTSWVAKSSRLVIRDVNQMHAYVWIWPTYVKPAEGVFSQVQYCFPCIFQSILQRAQFDDRYNWQKLQTYRSENIVLSL